MDIANIGKGLIKSITQKTEEVNTSYLSRLNNSMPRKKWDKFKDGLEEIGISKKTYKKAESFFDGKKNLKRGVTLLLLAGMTVYSPPKAIADTFDMTEVIAKCMKSAEMMKLKNKNDMQERIFAKNVTSVETMKKIIENPYVTDTELLALAENVNATSDILNLVFHTVLKNNEEENIESKNSIKIKAALLNNKNTSITVKSILKDDPAVKATKLENTQDYSIEKLKEIVKGIEIRSIAAMEKINESKKSDNKKKTPIISSMENSVDENTSPAIRMK